MRSKSNVGLFLLYLLAAAVLTLRQKLSRLFLRNFAVRVRYNGRRKGGGAMTVVYLDRVVLLNLAVDCLLLLATARLAGLPLRRRRLGLCAALGAA